MVLKICNFKKLHNVSDTVKFFRNIHFRPKSFAIRRPKAAVQYIEYKLNTNFKNATSNFFIAHVFLQTVRLFESMHFLYTM
jgi:hypothetical protein